MKPKNLELVFFFVLLAIVGATTWFIAAPYAYTIFMAIAFAVMFFPLYERILHIVKGRESLASLMTATLIFLIIVLPIGIISYQVILEARNIYAALASGVFERSTLNTYVVMVERSLAPLLPGFDIDIDAYLQQGAQWIATNAGVLFTQFAGVTVNFFLFVFALYYFIKDGTRFRATVMDLSPLDTRYDVYILQQLKIAIDSVFRGTLIIAMIQGVVAGTGFAIFGVPNPVLLAIATMIAALVPYAGTGLVVIPSVVYLFLTGNTGAGFGLAIWGAVAVGFIDNLLSPFLIGKGAKMHPFVVLIAVLGGIQVFGALGFLVGPFIVSLLFALLNVYRVLIGRTGIPDELKTKSSRVTSAS